jgi:protein farnesyltransferase subunit beta
VTFHIRGIKHRPKVRFTNQTMPASSSQKESSASSLPVKPESRNQSGIVMEELTEDDDLWEEDPGLEMRMPTRASLSPFIPDLFTTLPPLRDSTVTMSSELQAETVHEILPYLAAKSGEFEAYNHYGTPRLDRPRHIRFLHKILQNLPSQYVAADAARPWFFYWALCGLQTLGQDVTSYRQRLISSVQPMQNATGGFGSGHGQMSHLAPTYAIVLSLSIVGDNALDVIDRMAMWRWLGALKQPDGGFQMFIGGEEDVRWAIALIPTWSF